MSSIKKLSWDNIEKASDELVWKIKASGFEADYIIGITVGGLIPLYFLVKKLGIKNILTVSASSYEKDKQKELKITYLPETDLKNKKILLVDEIADTGASLEGVLGAVLDKYEPDEIKTAVFVLNKEKSRVNPDFYYMAKQDDWVVFPWERAEFPEYF